MDTVTDDRRDEDWDAYANEPAEEDGATDESLRGARRRQFFKPPQRRARRARHLRDRVLRRRPRGEDAAVELLDRPCPGPAPPAPVLGPAAAPGWRAVLGVRARRDEWCHRHGGAGAGASGAGAGAGRARRRARVARRRSDRSPASTARPST